MNNENLLKTQCSMRKSLLRNDFRRESSQSDDSHQAKLDVNLIDVIWNDYEILIKEHKELSLQSNSEDEKIDEYYNDELFYNSPHDYDKVSYLCPKNSTRTYISKNKRLNELNTWINHDPYECVLIKNINILKDFLNNQKLFKLNDCVINECVYFYKYISDIYKKNKKSKSNDKIFIFTIYCVLKKYDFNIKLNNMSEILNINNKLVFKKYKQIINELKNNNYIKTFKEDKIQNININKYLDDFNFSNDIKKKIINLVLNKKQLLSEKENDNLLYIGAIYYVGQCYNLNISKEKIIKVFNVSNYILNNSIKLFK